MLGFLATYVRYYQVRAYLPEKKTIANKMGLFFGVVTALAILLVANFEV